MPGMHWVLILAVMLFTATAALIDLRWRKIPNWLTVSAFACALVYHAVAGGLSGVGTAMLGMLTGFGILLVLWLIGGGGGGDVKLMAAVGAWLGPIPTLYVFFLSAGFALLFGLIVILVSGIVAALGKGRGNAGASAQQNDKTAAGSVAPARWRTGFGAVMPYAVPVAASCWAVLLWQYVIKHV